jgi:acyl-CoA synthetase (AMP-forming)/AMP-acid ligase II
VVSVPDGEWGEAVAAVVAFKPGHTGLTLGEVVEWAGSELPKYQVPTVVKLVDRFPRNTMGKINKKSLRKELFDG